MQQGRRNRSKLVCKNTGNVPWNLPLVRESVSAMFEFLPLKWLDVAREICVKSYSLRNLYIKSVIWSLDIFRPCMHAVTSVVSNSLRPHGPTRLLCPWDLPGKNTRMVTILFSRGSSQPRDQTWVSYVSCIGRWVLYLGTTWEATGIIPTVDHDIGSLFNAWWSVAVAEAVAHCDSRSYYSLSVTMRKLLFYAFDTSGF